MKKLVRVAALLLTVLAPREVTAEVRNSGASGVTIEVSVLRSQRGTVACRLYAQGGGFPSEPTHIKEQRVKAAGPTVRCSFTELPAGTYAVAVLHDENGNGTLDTNFLGIPKEGVGVTMNPKPRMRAPRWDEAKFELAAGAHPVLAVLLGY